ncbi:MAG: hypothetical protein MK211_00100 [Flavobacteriales bacterium]|nr:hypothetical protein [Flavobacteriales bacterium]
MRKILVLLFAMMLLACSSEEKKMETVRELAKKDLITQLQLPEGTTFNDEEIQVSEKASDLEKVDATYTVIFTINSQDAAGNPVTQKHTLTYAKIGEGGLNPDDYELTAFD